MEKLPDKFKRSCGEIEKILRKDNLGFLGMCKNGMPYVIPVTYVYTSGKILFHCALHGKKLDYIRANPHVCFTTGRQYGKVMHHPRSASCKADHDSAVCHGKARIIDDINERCKVLNTFNQCLQPDAEKILPKEVANCYVIEIAITEMTGRRQRKGLERTYWEYRYRVKSK